MTKDVPKSAWVPSGVDPTDLDYPLPGATPKGCLSKIWSFGIIGLAMYGLFALYQQSVPKVDASRAPDVLATSTQIPTTAPTATTLPGTPTPTPRPTETPAPTATATLPGSMATWTPGPWLITRWAATHAAILGTPQEDGQ